MVWTRRLMEMLDVDHAMRNEMASTRDMLWGLRADCIDVERMFNQLGYRSHRLQQRQDTLMAVLDHCCDGAPCWRFWPTMRQCCSACARSVPHMVASR
jgi:hypothetical protein